MAEQGRKSSGVARGGARAPPPEFGRSVNPIQTREAEYAPYSTTSPPGFKKLSTLLESEHGTTK